jgi:D-alanyl-D-alanine carboxypeptidase (penicillin-binding protein 5/6)
VGLDQPGNHTSPRDLARLVLRLRRWRFFRAVINRTRAVLRTGDHRRIVVNRNTLVREFDWVTGVKTGHTRDAGYVLVGSATRDGVNVISVEMGDPSEATRDADSLRLLRYGLGRFRIARPLVRGRPVGRAAIHYRRGEHVAIVPARTVRFVASRARRVSVRLDIPARVDGPLDKGAVVGRALVRYGGRRMAEVQLVTAEAVPAAGLGQRMVDYFTRTFTLVLVLVLVVCVVPLVLLRARAVRRRRRRQARSMGTGTA